MDGISYLVAVTQIKAANANDEALDSQKAPRPKNPALAATPPLLNKHGSQVQVRGTLCGYHSHFACRATPLSKLGPPLSPA